MAAVDLYSDVRSVLGESPIWSLRERTLYHVDISTKRVFATCDGRTLPPLLLAGQVGCVVPRARGGLLACLENTVVPCNVESQTVGSPLVSFPTAPGVRFNDGKCDPQGRLWVGSMHSSWRDPASPPASLFCIRASELSPRLSTAASPWLLASGAVAAAAAALAVGRSSGRSGTTVGVCAGAAALLAGAALAADNAGGIVQPEAAATVTTVLADARLPNGMTWTADGRTMFWIDSATNNVDAFDFDAANGSLSNRRVVIRCPRQGAGVFGAVAGIPDGMTIDAAGRLWVVLGESGCVVQYDPATARQLSAVALPVKRPTACTFGGADLSELFVTTREDGSAHAGSLFRVRIPGVRGLDAAYEYAG